MTSRFNQNQMQMFCTGIQDIDAIQYVAIWADSYTVEPYEALLLPAHVVRWNCANCGTMITIDMSTKLKSDDFLCKDCKDYPQLVDVAKSANVLFMQLKRMLYSNMIHRDDIDISHHIAPL